MKRFLGWLFIVVSLVLLIGPYLVPIPELTDTVPPRQLADADSRFMDVDGLEVHYRIAGDGMSTFMLLHGFGASVFTWRAVFDDFSALGRTLAWDRTAFGLTERPIEWSGDNPYATTAQIRQATGIMDALRVERAILVGNSAGGRTAVSIALARPERVRALILVGPAIGFGGGGSNWYRPLLHTPQMDRLGPWLVRRIAGSAGEMLERAWHDTSLFDETVVAGYRKPLRAQDWDRALWEFTRAPRGEPGSHVPLEERLAELEGIPTLVITGDDDRIVPGSKSKAVADAIPGSSYVELTACGHVPQEECPAAFMVAVRTFLADSILDAAPEPPRPVGLEAAPVGSGG